MPNFAEKAHIPRHTGQVPDFLITDSDSSPSLTFRDFLYFLSFQGRLQYNLRLSINLASDLQYLGEIDHFGVATILGLGFAGLGASNTHLSEGFLPSDFHQSTRL